MIEAQLRGKPPISDAIKQESLLFNDCFDRVKTSISVTNKQNEYLLKMKHCYVITSKCLTKINHSECMSRLVVANLNILKVTTSYYLN